MSKYTFEKSKLHNIYPNITVYDRLCDGEPAGWRINANEGYVFYDTNAHDKEIDPESMEEIPVTYYYTIRYFPRIHNWESFSLAALPESDVDQRYIFG